ncbi:Zn-dependent peptidase ImmA (M78 family) [Herbaspirillum sp. 1173]|uniref:ImmA/IrrE family metallo-endopeptidase n=1 Tax=Herbaspirillum sp. 1173 TaxID=2817734 RepID=UPI00286487A1|nr:ImmA/IrrE family metallo-endopeptidase [Herbaspirillum sp. 1173]MDR6739790.1 Zn-dependent peptidase ImmA (M78 family) [Herbaspirillum sp. 1173]
MTTVGARAEALITDFGITEPKDIDVEALAYASGLEVAYEQLQGCEATLVGFQDHGIATINPCGIRGRERFSIAHELGHWQLHRGRSFQCRVDEQSVTLASERSLEKEADTFASHLLLPGSIFRPRMAVVRQPGFKQIREAASEFETSNLATALRLVNMDFLPVMIALYDRNGRRWSIPSAHVPRRWTLKQMLDEDTFAYDLVFGGKEKPGGGKQSADAWFENDDAGRYEVHEECVAHFNGSAIVLLYLETDMMEAKSDWNVGRKYGADGSFIPRRAPRS